jgi:hypothetical protein
VPNPSVLLACGGFPGKARQLACAGDVDHTGWLASFGELASAVIEALLAAPGDVDDMRLDAALAAFQRLADASPFAHALYR